jgi:hypothetical protein
MANSITSLWMKLIMRLATKLGVSLQITTPLPSTLSAKSFMRLMMAGSVSGVGMISSRCR